MFGLLKRKKVKPKSAPVPYEEQEQIAFIAWCDLMARKHPVFSRIFHIPNGEIGVAAGVKFKKLGVKKGVPDLCLPLPRKGHCSLWIEMKRQKGGTVSPEQQEYMDFLTAHGHYVAVCKGFDEAKKVVCWYLNL